MFGAGKYSERRAVRRTHEPLQTYHPTTKTNIRTPKPEATAKSERLFVPRGAAVSSSSKRAGSVSCVVLNQTNRDGRSCNQSTTNNKHNIQLLSKTLKSCSCSQHVADPDLSDNGALRAQNAPELVRRAFVPLQFGWRLQHRAQFGQSSILARTQNRDLLWAQHIRSFEEEEERANYLARQKRVE